MFAGTHKGVFNLVNLVINFSCITQSSKHFYALKYAVVSTALND
jgi:hypothetical protein